MLQIKNIFDKVEPQDGLRYWVGPGGLTRDMIEWCSVDRWLKEGSPSERLAQWFDDNPRGWEYFRAKHHEELNQSGALRDLRILSHRGMGENITLLHADSDPEHNVAVSLYEFLVELQAYAPDEE